MDSVVKDEIIESVEPLSIPEMSVVPSPLQRNAVIDSSSSGSDSEEEGDGEALHKRGSDRLGRQAKKARSAAADLPPGFLDPLPQMKPPPPPATKPRVSFFGCRQFWKAGDFEESQNPTSLTSNITVVHDDQIILRIVGDCFTPDGHSVSTYITKKFKERQCVSGSTWRHVDQDLKKFYYGEFLKKYIWEPGHETKFKEIWNNYCHKLYKDLLYKWRKKGTRPSHVPDEIWDAWKNIWAAEKWQQYSSTARNNRNTELAGPSTGSTKHTAGSRSIVEHAIKLTDTLQRSPTCWEIFRTTHKKKDDTFVDARSKAIDDDMTDRVAQASQSAIEGEELQTLSHDAINDIYYEVVGGKKKNSLYGLGSQAKVVYDRVMTPRHRGHPSSSSTEVQALRQENQKLRDRVTALEQSRVNEQSMEDRVKTLVERQMREFIDQWSPNFQPSYGFDSHEIQDPNTTDK